MIYIGIRDIYDTYSWNILGSSSSASVTWSAVSGTLGRFQNGTSISYQFYGILSLFEICESTTAWDNSATTRASLLSTQLDLYENYWDLTQGTTYSGTASRNPCKRRQQLGLSNTYFTHKATEQPPFPTDQGWFSLQRDSYIFAENVDLSNTHQFTVEFEMFLIDPYYYVIFYLNQDWSNLGRYISFTNYYSYYYGYNVYTYTYVMSASATSSIYLSKQRWYKVSYQ